MTHILTEPLDSELHPYEKAGSIYNKLFTSIDHEVLGQNSQLFLAILTDRATLSVNLGLYTEAERDVSFAALLGETILGEYHPDYARSLNGLAGLFAKTMSYDQAELFYTKALTIGRSTLGEHHPDYARSLNGLAELYVEKGSYQQANSLYIQTIAIYSQAGLEDHPDYARSLNGLATSYAKLGSFDQAELYYKQALTICKSALGADHPDYARSLNGLAALYAKEDSFDQAELLYKQALSIRKSALGADHPDYATNLYDLGSLYMAKGLLHQAEPFLREALDRSREVLNRTALIQSEQQQLAMGEILRHRLDVYLSLSLSMGDQYFESFERILLWKGAVLVRQRQYRQTASDTAVTTEFAESQDTTRIFSPSWRRGFYFHQLQTTTQRLASVARDYPTQEEEVAKWWVQLWDLNTQRNKLEASLSDLSVSSRQAQRKVTIAEVAGALPQDAVFVDFLEFNKYLPPPNRRITRSILASVLRPDGDVTLIDLGSQEVVAKAIETWRQTFGLSGRGIEAARLLRQRVWDPLLPALGTAKTVLISLDGVLGRLPVGALPGDTPGTYLLEDYALAFLPVPQLLPKLSKQRQVQDVRSLLLVGGVDYDTRQSVGVGVSKSAFKSDPLVVAQVRGGTHFGPLDATLPEVKRVGGLFKRIFNSTPDAITLLSHSAATEDRFRTLAPTFDILHLATHGFFAPPKEGKAQAFAQAARAQRSAVYGRENPIIQAIDPGLLSGLVLSGANQPPQPEQDDGILTATEIAMLPLTGVDLVVLSACETGLGEIAGGEGLLGVQRAFQVAGARSTVASLWKVPDFETRLLMERFYRNLWERQLSGLEALREAQLWMLKDPEGPKSQVEERGLDPALPSSSNALGRSSPLYWAAFQLSGDWR